MNNRQWPGMNLSLHTPPLLIVEAQADTGSQ